MNLKFTLKVLNTDGSIKREKDYKTLREIAKDLNIEYHQIREINRITENKIDKKFLHPTLKDLSKQIEIHDKKIKTIE